MSTTDTAQRKRFRSSVVISNGTEFVVNMEVTATGFGISVDVDGQTAFVEPTNDPDAAIKAVKVMVADAIRLKDGTPEEAQMYAEGVAMGIRNGLVSEGYLTVEKFNPCVNEDGTQNEATTRQMERVIDIDYENVLRDLFQQEIPQTMGGYPMLDFVKKDAPRNKMIFWDVTWGDQEYEIHLWFGMPIPQYNEGARLAADRLRGQIQEKVARLKMEHPGDFEVECTDATGEEDKFDEGSTYLAEAHLDQDLFWVYDRFGQRGEYGKFRFRRVP